MFNIINYNIIAQEENQYLSFPDIIQSKSSNSTYFMVYRSGDRHHPTYSYLHFLVSKDSCQTWEESYIFEMHLREDKQVWNCPRLSYLPNGDLVIICDTKSGQDEMVAKFKVYFIISRDNGLTFYKPIPKNFFASATNTLETNSFDGENPQHLTNKYYNIKETEMYGMVPDKIVKFKNKLFCANHIRDDENRTLTQLVNVSKDKGRTWYDCHILGRNPGKYAFCEASLVNFKDKFLIAYVRDNYNPPRKIHKFISKNGSEWIHKGEVPAYGHRPTALIYDRRLIMTYRNTQEPGIDLLTAHLDVHGKEIGIDIYRIDDESIENLYHCGYTGLVRCGTDKFCVVYYIKKRAKNPYIKSCIFKYKKF